jgi:hypothetical protein
MNNARGIFYFYAMHRNINVDKNIINAGCAYFFYRFECVISYKDFIIGLDTFFLYHYSSERKKRSEKPIVLKEAEREEWAKLRCRVT